MSDIILGLAAGFFVKDGRGWYTGETNRSFSYDWPPPSTLRGLLRTAYGRAASTPPANAAEWTRTTKGIDLRAALALRRSLGEAAWRAEHRMWPHPQDCLLLPHPSVDQVAAECMDPQPTPDDVTVYSGGDPLSKAADRLWRPRWSHTAKPRPRWRWWPDASFVQWLAHPASASQPVGAFQGGELPARTECHVTIDPATLAAEPGGLFSHAVMEGLSKGSAGTTAEWGVTLRYDAESARNLGALSTLGGDRRLTSVSPGEPGVFAFPPELKKALSRPTSGFRLVAVTPLLFADGWLPDGLSVTANQFPRGRLSFIDGSGAHHKTPPIILRAAFVDRPEHVSGWDMANRCPKPTRRLCPPGSVFFFECEGDWKFDAALAERLWLGRVGGSPAEGWGLVVPGRWESAHFGSAPSSLETPP